MSAESPLTAMTACPRCDKSPLTPVGEAYRCDGCKTDFPSIADIPWLFAEPDASLGEWRNRLHFALQQLSTDAKRLKSDLKSDTLPALTRQRLEKQLKAADEHRSALRQILAPVGVQSAQASYESYLALRTRLPTDQGISTYYGNIHRDWAWGDEENAASLVQISAVTDGGKALGNTLVLGAGACRLAYDIHAELDTEFSVAMDFNPLLLLIANTVMQGGKQELYEFPIAPKSIDDFAVLRTLSAPQPVDDRLQLVFGDALRPPFASGIFDTVVTPWLIDIVDEDLPVQAARINQLLKPGGRWINFGSLAFSHADQSRCYSTEETLDLVEKAGFGAPQVKEEEIPYMCSPASRHGRRENVLTFAARKTGKIKAPARHKALPDWIVTAKEPVPLSQSFRNQAMSTQIYAFIMSLIDGKRTITDMAKILEQQKLMTAAEAVPAIRTFLTRMYDDAQKSTGF